MTATNSPRSPAALPHLQTLLLAQGERLICHPEIADVRRKDKCGLTILLLEVISGASPPFPHKAKALPVHIFTLKIGHF